MQEAKSIPYAAIRVWYSLYDVTKDNENRENDYFNRIATCINRCTDKLYTNEKLRTFEDVRLHK